MLYVCVQRFDIIENFEKNLKLYTPLVLNLFESSRFSLLLFFLISHPRGGTPQSAPPCFSLLEVTSERRHWWW